MFSLSSPAGHRIRPKQHVEILFREVLTKWGQFNSFQYCSKLIKPLEEEENRRCKLTKLIFTACWGRHLGLFQKLTIRLTLTHNDCVKNFIRVFQSVKAGSKQITSNNLSYSRQTTFCFSQFLLSTSFVL